MKRNWTCKFDPDLVLGELIQQVKHRATVGEILAEAILSANAAAPEHWSLTLQKSMYRLNVGAIEVLTGDRNGIAFVLFGGSVPEKLRDSLEPGYRRVGGSCRLEVVYSKAGSAWRAVQHSSGQLISLAGRSALAGGRARAHCDRLVEHISNMTGRRLPQPGWYLERAQGEDLP